MKRYIETLQLIAKCGECEFRLSDVSIFLFIMASVIKCVLNLDCR